MCVGRSCFVKVDQFYASCKIAGTITLAIVTLMQALQPSCRFLFVFVRVQVEGLDCVS